MQSGNSDAFREAMAKKISSFKEEKIFEIIPIDSKSKEKSLIPFIWLLKRKRNPMGDLIKYKARLCIHSGRQVKGVNYWNTCAPVAQSTTTRIMLILYQMNGWHCRHLDYVLAFTQVPTDTDLYLKILTGFHIEDKENNDISDEYCLKLLKNCYSTKDATANWFNVLQRALQ